MSSHHILRLYDPDYPTHTVDLLIRDEDLYFVALRSCLGDIEEQGNWSVWFRFSNAVIASFLPSVEFDMKFDYGTSDECKPGGSIMAMENMFFALALFDRDRQVDTQFKRAIFSVVVLFCEARRLPSIRTLMSNRIANQTNPEELGESYWSKVTDWSSFGNIVVQAHKYHWLLPGSVLPKNFRDKYADLQTMEDLVGDNGELLLIKFMVEQMAPEWLERQKKVLWSQRSSENAKEPEFLIPPRPLDGQGPHPGY